MSDQCLVPIKSINVFLPNKDSFVGKYLICMHIYMDQYMTILSELGLLAIECFVVLCASSFQNSRKVLPGPLLV